jgi:excisionase family DNA binding protein
VTSKLLTIREAAELVGLSYERLWAAARSGDLSTVRFAARGVYRTTEEDVDRWIASHRREAKPRRRVVASTEPAPVDLQALMPIRRRFA